MRIDEINSTNITESVAFCQWPTIKERWPRKGKSIVELSVVSGGLNVILNLILCIKKKSPPFLGGPFIGDMELLVSSAFHKTVRLKFGRRPNVVQQLAQETWAHQRL